MASSMALNGLNPGRPCLDAGLEVDSVHVTVDLYPVYHGRTCHTDRTHELTGFDR
jgi:hypothetical protein